MDELNMEIWESYSKINKAINKLVKLDAERLGLTAVQLKVLYKLASNPDIGVGELAEKLRITNSTVSTVIDRLVHLGLVERIIPPENRRIVSIHLTEKGKLTLGQLFSSDSCFIKKADITHKLPEEEISQLLRLQNLVLSKLTIEEENVHEH